jgi:hypothetical protein
MLHFTSLLLASVFLCCNLYLDLYVLYFIYPPDLNNNVGSNMMQPKSSEEEEEMLEQNIAIPFKKGIQDQSLLSAYIQWQDCRR